MTNTIPLVHVINNASTEDTKKLNHKLLKTTALRFIVPVVMIAVVVTAIEVIGRKLDARYEN